MLTRFLIGTVPLGAMILVGWWLRDWLRPVRPSAWDAHRAPDGYEMQVVTVAGCVLWERFTHRDVRDDQAFGWQVADHVVLVRDPGRGWQVVWGEDLLDVWEAMWPVHG